MRALWSFWSKPFQARFGSPWFSAKHFLLAWILSVETARRHYPDTALVTDNDGAKMLVDGLGLDFNSVSTRLNELAHLDPALWTLGKLYAYKCQTAPFIHLDNDVFLWERLPVRMERASLLAQNPEDFTVGESRYYMPDRFEHSLFLGCNGWLPKEWRWYRAQRQDTEHGICCGIFGGNHIDFIQYYANLAIRIVEHPRNRVALQALEQKDMHAILLEQYLLFVCTQYCQDEPSSPYQGITVEYLFDSTADAYRQALRTGFTHLIANAKSNEAIAHRLEARVQRDYPLYYENCIRYLSNR